MQPGTYWGTAAALSETSGILTTLGLLHPLGPLGTMAAMTMATATAHWGKPIWATAGGAELPVTNIAAALALMLTGPGRYSLDEVFGIKLPRPLVIVAILAAAGAVVYGIVTPPADQQDT